MAYAILSGCMVYAFPGCIFPDLYNKLMFGGVGFVNNGAGGSTSILAKSRNLYILQYPKGAFLLLQLRFLVYVVTKPYKLLEDYQNWYIESKWILIITVEAGVHRLLMCI